MSETTLQLQIPLLLPRTEDECEQCIQRLNEQIANQKGIHQAHIEHQDGAATICLHYDPSLLTMERAQRLAQQAGAQVTRRYCHESLHVTGMDCADCASSIEHIIRRVPGILDTRVSYAAERLSLEYDTTQIGHQQIISRVRSLGYGVEEGQSETWLDQNRELVLAFLSGLFLGLALLVGRLAGVPGGVVMALYVVSYAAGGYDATRHGVEALLHRRFEVDLLMVFAAIGAAALGDRPEGALLLFLFSFGHSLEHYAMDRARHAVEALGQLAPRTARVRRDGQETEMPVAELQRGDLVIVRPGERLPIDGLVAAGVSAVDQSAITGESVPVEKNPGANVFAGSLNGEGGLEIEVTRLARDTTLARVMEMVEEAQTQKSPVQQITERIERVFVPAVLTSVALVIVVPPLAGWLSWPAAFLRAMTLLVAASPCALAIATPAAVLSGVAQAARHGVLFKGGAHLENLGKVQAIAFDKTGTITRGQAEVTDVIVLPGMRGLAGPTADHDGGDGLLALAAAVESRSGHPLAQAVVRAAQARQLSLRPASKLQSLPGLGVRADVGGAMVSVGSVRLFFDGGCQVPDDVVCRLGALEAEGKTTMLVQRDQEYLGIIALADRPRAGVDAALSSLRRMGVGDLIMLTGDNARVADAIARETGLTGYEAGLMPGDKLTAIRRLIEKHGALAMVGDGVNDAPALAAATVGVAMGAGGSDVALETADVALMGSDLSRLPYALALSRRCSQIVRQNLLIAMGVIALLIPAAVLGVAGIGPAIALHEGSTVAVVLNALRLLRFRDGITKAASRA